MKKIILFCAVVFCFSTSNVFAADLQTKAAIEKMFNLINMDETYLKLYSQMEVEYVQMVSQMDVPPGKESQMKQQFKQLSAQMRSQLSWENIKSPMIEVYSKNFSRDEIEQLNAFYQSPLGRKVLEKAPQLTEFSAQLIQSHFQTIMPKMLEFQHNMTVEFAQLD